MSKIPLTLTIIQQNDRVLLGMKKRGFGVGRWNGFGGKVGEGETIETAAWRELSEEAGIRALALKKLGILEFSFVDKPGEKLIVHVFKTSDYSGEPSESEEMRPQWFTVNEIPYEEMWSSDVHWLPLLLADKPFKGSFLFDQNEAVMEKELIDLTNN